ncbi:IS481 family transposase [Mesorhizobium sp. WSM3860]|uniref:IS481 family transposase n=1 Tax=Mesorhizobium sp. WSM3860 TaxID=2029403 RepID=UPI000BAF9174|nr:IS481 family transposase [Mesorhizobium sp. WSM3860]PBC03404.1 IS481 family transposase [Mesorhizobium sp. WSM3860]
MSQKEEFVRLALAPDANVSALCRRFGIGRTCGHKLLARFRAEGDGGLAARSRRPRSSPRRSPPELEAAVVSLRKDHPAWGGRKIAGVLARDGVGGIAPSTVTDILRRNGVELGLHGGGAQPFIRFEHEAPNDLWQMDFKGHVPLRQGRLHPLTVLDDHSRFSLVLEACADQTTETVKTRLIAAFRRYGLPWRIATDNGPPWGDGGRNNFTALGVWLIEIGVSVGHSRPCHPQTLGKEERFHRTLKAEALQGPPFESLQQAQHVFDRWRHLYNTRRPHQGIGGAVPFDRYRASGRDFCETVAPFEYAVGDNLRKIQQKGATSLFGRAFKICNAFAGKTVAFRPTEADGVFDAYFRHQKIQTIDLNTIRR